MPNNPKSILVMDKEELICESLQEFLERRGYTTYATISETDGLVLIKEKRPALVLLDIHMLNEDAIDMIINLRKQDQNTKVIIISSFEKEYTDNKTAALGAVTVLYKPVQLRELVGIIEDNIHPNMQKPASKASGELLMSVSKYFKKYSKEFEVFKKNDIDPIIDRYGEIEIAYPVSEKEYCALGGYSFIKITAIATDPRDLPIARAYFQFKDKKIRPLDNLEVAVGDRPSFTNVVIETQDDKGREYFISFSFWAILSGLFLDDAGSIAIDFKGERKAFTLLRGPWGLGRLTREWIQKHASEQIQVATEPIEYDVIANFLQREFNDKGKEVT